MKNINRNSIIAKILAGENIHLVVQENLPTASFDLKTRIIRIPDYMFEDDDFTTMVVGHEVGHCLYTPHDEWHRFINDAQKDSSLNDKQKSLIGSVVNILEDVRIDELMRKRYPGLTKYYRNACKFMKESDFFKIVQKNKDLKTMNFVDKFCVYSKCDVHNTIHFYGIKFDSEEQKYVDRTYAAKTFKEICDLSLEIIKKFSMNDIDSNFDDHSTEDSSESSSNSNDSSSESPLKDRMEIDEDYMTKSSEPSEEKSPYSMGSLGGTNELLADIWKQSIQKSVNIAKSNSYFNKNQTKQLFEIQTIEFSDFRSRHWGTTTHDAVSNLNIEYRQYVSSFANKFNQRKRAKELVNNFEKNMGNIDPLKLHKYVYDDNIFQKKDIENYQKNHGFIFLVDCSSSMSNVFKSLTQQLFAFYKICERIDVPFAAYGYTTGEFGKQTNFNSGVKFYKFMERGDRKQSINDTINDLIHGNISMGGTPTSDALLGLIPEVKRFRSRYNPDILNFVVITDGSDGIGMDSNYLSFRGAMYKNVVSPRGIIDNNAAIYSLLREFYDLRIFHMDITNTIPHTLLDRFESNNFLKDKFLHKKEFGGANNVLWIEESLIKNKSTTVVDSLVDIMA